jgi:transposase
VILLSSAVRIHIAVEPVTMRHSFDGLMAQVRSVLAQAPFSGRVFAFINRRRNQVKLLMWTRGGFTIIHKRLEVGTFPIGGDCAAM